MGNKAATILFQSKAWLAAAIVFGETARHAPDDVAVLAGFGSAVANSAGVFVVAPFVQWSTRILRRCLELAPSGPYANLARERLAELRKKPEWKDLPPIRPEDFDELLTFLDINTTIVVEAIDSVAPDDHMFMVMALGNLGAPRFVPALAAAVSGRWGAEAARSALKRVGKFQGRREIREAMVALRESPLGAECDPYLSWAEQRAPPAEDSAPPPAPPAKKPWWKLW